MSAAGGWAHRIGRARVRAVLRTLASGLGVLLGLACASTGEAPPAPPWQSAFGVDQPLVGRIWDVRAQHDLTPEELLARLSRRPFVLLGEKHDNPDHHRIQAWILRGLAATGQRPAVAFEMFRPDQLSEIERARHERPQDPDHLARAADWAASGWPEFALYRPLLAATLAAGLEIRSANLSTAELEGLRTHGFAGLDAAFVAAFGLDRPLTRERGQALKAAIRAAHCGHAPEAALEAMVRVQRARDARMARSLLERGGGVLIAGNAHVRRDHGVPTHLSKWSVAVLGLLEVREGDARPPPYAEAPFDYVWFSPRVDDLDPCEKFREQLERLRGSDAGHGHGLGPRTRDGQREAGNLDVHEEGLAGH